MRTFWAVCRWVLAIVVGAVVSAYGSILFKRLFPPALTHNMISELNHNLLLVLLALNVLLDKFFSGALGAAAAVFINRKIRPFLTAYLTIAVVLLLNIPGMILFGGISLLTVILVACSAVGLLAGGTYGGLLGWLVKNQPPRPPLSLN